ncbi:MAG: hypothetical protein EOO99_03115 [Pedobacter sp.]|nr:MAG: hypothetical protein EOO99_03115 [Pedobacter sp.]
MKRFAFILIILLLSVITIAYFYFKQLNAHSAASDQAINQITSQSGLVFKVEYNKNSFEILASQDLLQKLNGEADLSFLNSILAFTQKNGLQNLLEGQPVFMGLIPQSAKPNQLLITIQATDEIPNRFLNASNIKALSPNYYEITQDSIPFYVYKNKNFLSASGDLEVLKKLSHKNPEPNEFTKFIKSQSTFQKAQIANLYIDFKRLNPYFKSLLKDAATADLGFFIQANYAKLDYNFSKNQILFTGFNEYQNSQEYIRLFESQTAQKAEILNLLPATTKTYQVFTYSSYQDWSSDLLKWQQDNQSSQTPLTDFNAIESKYGLKLKESITPYFKNQFILFQLKSGEKLGAIQLSDGEKVGQLLLDLSSPYNLEINGLKEKHLFKTFFGLPFSKFEKPFYTIIDNYLILANFPSSLQVFLNQYKADKTLVNLPAFQFYQSQISPSNISMYWNQNKSFDSFSIHLIGDKNKFSSSYLAIPKDTVTQVTSE